jgi:uncharacterized damage-inducible protein DinB
MPISLVRELAYDHWANKATFEKLAALGAATPDGVRRWMNHIVGTEYTWLARIVGRKSVLSVWPEIDLDACGTRLADLPAKWTKTLAEHPPVKLVTYKNSKGESYENSVEDIVLHVVHHGAYHRGQIAAALRAAGHEPPYTDFIHYARSIEKPAAAKPTI